MSALKTYFKQELKRSMFGLEYPKPSDFYLSAWQTTRSAVPLLIFRALLFLTAFSIVIASVVYYIQSGLTRYWLIYLTHWGLLTILASTFAATCVSARVHFYGPISAEFSLPWYVKTHWVLYNIATPLAFLITIFYWTILYNSEVQEELNKGLDIAVHGLNSVVMFLLLVSSSMRSRLLHFYQPFLLALGWAAFSLIYYFAGGTDPFGRPFVYPVVHWANPGSTIAVILVTGVLEIFLHLAVVGLTAINQAAAARLIKPSVINHIEEGTPLRQTNIPK